MPGSKQLQEDLSNRYSAQEPLIFLLRHGQIQGHETKRFTGGRTDTPLDDIGRAQAISWQRPFSEIRFGAIYSSELKRCIETAELICPEKEIDIDPRINEIDMGTWDGKSFAELCETMPQQFERRGSQIDHFRPPGGESFNDLSDRVLPFFKGCGEAGESQQLNRILVVTHAGVIRVLVSSLLGINLKQIFQIKIDYCQLFLISNTT